MKITNIYKKTAALFFLMAAALWPAVDALGQAYGDRYYSTGVAKVSGVTVHQKPTATGENPIEYAIDGDETTNWKSSTNDENEVVVFDVGEEVSYFNIKTIELYVKDEKRRAESVTIETLYEREGKWYFVKTIPNFYETDRHSISIDYLYSRYVRLTFTKRPADSTDKHEQVNLNEIYFYAAGVDLTGISIQHKPAKWYDLRDALQINNAADNFDDDESLSMNIAYDNQTEIQAAHTLIDTIYVHAGTSVTLTLPDYLDGATNNKTYQRWYNYLTEGTFATNKNGIVDYLTPGTAGNNMASNGTGYRFKNGYIGQPLSSACLYVMDFYVPETDYDNWYLVACDVSGYTDYTGEFNIETSKNSSFAPNYYEPTLSHRFIYYIRVIEDDTSWAAKQLNAGNPIEEKDITMPATRLPDYTDEMVALSMDARSYLTPTGGQNEANGNLTVSLDNNTAGITLQTTSLSGEERVIFINYPVYNSDNTKSVNSTNDGSDPKATVNVSRNGTLVARYNLTFKEESRLLTQTQVSNENEKEDSDYRYRMPDYLNENYELLTELNFDFDDAVASQYGLPQCYPFPLGWNSSTYGFYDGSVEVGDFTGPTGSHCPEWGYYGILNSYVECRDKNGDNWGWTSYTYDAPKDTDPIRFNSKGNQSTYHLYADVSDRPGVIARLPFDRKLCPGTELFVTAWVKCARGAKDANNAAALFSIMGVKSREVGSSSTKDYTPIFRYQTGQIPATYRNDGNLNVDGFHVGQFTYDGNGNITSGTGGNNDWLQVYFSFINTNSEDFESYVLQIDNNSASTNGGDIYIDDIRVYVMSPNAKVSQLEATCTNDRTLTNIELNWDQLMSRLGHDETQQGEDAIEFCFIDKTKYYNYLAEAEHTTDYEGAIKESVIKIGDTEDSGSDYHKLYFKIPFDANTSYNESESPRLASGNKTEGKEYFYGYTDEAGLKSLSVDFYSDLTPNRPYILLINHNAGDETLDASDFAYNIDDVCTIKTEFYVTAQTLIRVNGEVVDPSTDFCSGQVFNFSANLRVPTGVNEEDGTTIYTEIKEGVYFDWFFGTEEEFIAADPTYGDISLQSALTKFRDIFPDKENLEGVTAGEYTLPNGTSITLTQYDIDIINNYLNDTGAADGIHNRLVLHKENLDITLLASGLQLVVQPIRTLVPPGEITVDIWTAVCWSYIPLVLNTSGKAPALHAGFNSVTYPTEDFNPGLRIGLDQIKSTSGIHPLVVNLRGAEVVTKGAESIGMITSVTPEIFNKIYLVGTDDPEYNNDTYFPVDFGQYSLPIGTLKSLSAQPYVPGSGFIDKMEIYFDIDEGDVNEENDFNFQPKEGYTYTFAVHFEEKMGDSGEVSNVCFGSFTVDMKVVPEYLEWNDVQKDDPSQPQEVTIGNWNYDGNWKRIASTDINAATNNVSDYFTDGSNQTDNGFVPMLFSKVIIPENSKVELYAAGASGANWISYRPSHIAAISDSIQYDLMAYEHPSNDQTDSYKGQLKTERYRVSLLDEIHFEPGAEMLHAEYLLYNKAWVDYQLGKGRWYTLASPLKAVVAGDFYTDSDDGVEKQEYFTDITFTENAQYNNGAVTNNRFKPSVYQRAWKGESTEVPLYTDATTKKNVAISGNWSALTNDVAEKYEPGTGFSLKVQDVTDSATFRLPKADTQYSYYSQNGVQGSDNVSGISKVNAHRLQSDEIYQRTDNSTVGSIQVNEFTVPLGESADGQYYLVGNPFMAHLNMDVFFTKNSNLERKYWVVDNNSQTVAVGTKEDLTTTNPTGDVTVAPLQSFFVQKKTGVSNNDITFTQEMQTLGGTTDGLRSANALTITATTTDGRTSRAAVAYDMAASADYEASEDAELFLDSNLGDVPMVYTVAGTMATSINRTSELYNIPLGVYGSKQEMVTLSFGGLNQFSSATLYDAQEQTETPLREGKTVSVPAGTSGRYFLRAGTPTGNEVIARNAFLVYSVGGGKVMVTSSNTPLKDIRVYTMGGAQVRSIQASGMQQEIYLNRGIYLITVSDQDGLQETKKVLVR